jgi:hypothetical protein
MLVLFLSDCTTLWLKIVIPTPLIVFLKIKHEVVISNADTNIQTYNKDQNQELILLLVL